MKKLISLLLILTMLIPMSIFAVEGTDIPFTDVKESHWWYDAIAYCYENELLKGMSETEFGPTVTLTRAMFVQALATFEGVGADDLRDEVSPFTDVKPNHWFYTSVEWARQQGIVGGMTETTFSPNGALTRAQMARLFHQYAIYKELDTDITADLSAFEDAAKIPAWALDGMKYCVGTELFVGSDNKLTPSATATRAQLATVIMKFHGLNDGSCDHVWSTWMCTIAPTAEDTGIETRICTRCDAQQSRVVEKYTGRIVCWGDSVTQGIFTGFEDVAEVPYPERVGEILGVESLNYGIGGEIGQQIACRQGGIPFYVYASESMPFTIPADRTPVEIDLVLNEDGEPAAMGNNYIYSAINPMCIAGVWGELTRVEDTNIYHFTRLEEGVEITLTELTQVETFAMTDKREDDITVLWICHNDHYSVAGLPDLLATLDAMIAACPNEEYVVLGLMGERFVKDYAALNAGIKAHLEELGVGEKYLDVRSYLADPVHLENLEITPNERDLYFMSNGWIPASLQAE
ncbi:MAG: S-layer homology domain-containing protein, partial [Clostridia bacterium]|nr:S-layer homology domain-containing protein [Clostridia bacterium]